MHDRFDGFLITFTFLLWQPDYIPDGQLNRTDFLHKFLS